MNKTIKIGNFTIAEDSPAFLIAEMSANHDQDYGRAVEIVHAAKESGADAIKIQTYTADTITIDSQKEWFQIKNSLWAGTTLYKLYQEAYTPWEWQPKIKELANKLGMECFSSPFDFTSVDFLENLDMPAYKIASYEINDIPLIRKVASLKKPVLISTGIAHIEDIDLAIRTCHEAGNSDIILFKCTSAYPSPYEEVNLNTMNFLRERYDCIMGLSDHTMGTPVSVAAVAMGAKVIEKHFTLSRSGGGPDDSFSMEPAEFKKMTEDIRLIEKAMGSKEYVLTPKQEFERRNSRSLFVVKDMKKGEKFTPENLRSIRPSVGLHTRFYDEILGTKAIQDIEKGTPMEWNLSDFEKHMDSMRSKDHEERI